MMKRNWKTIGVTALCAAMLLAGCGARNDGADQNGGVDTPDNVDNGANRAAPIEAAALLDTVRAANDPRALLEKHDTVTVSIQGSDGEGNETYTARVQYSGGAGSDILMNSHYRYTENSGVGEDELWGDGNGGLYGARMKSDSAASLNLYPAGEYEQYILAMLPRCLVSSEGEQESIDGPDEQDGALLLTVTTSYEDFTDYYFTTLYYVDPATNELLAMSVTDYSVDEGGLVSELGTTRYNWSYDEPFKDERRLLNEVIFATDSAEDVCELTYFYPAPGAEKGWDVGEDGWSVSQCRVAHGTRVTFCCSTGCMLYADRELTQPIDDTQGVDTSGGSATVYIVPDAPQG